MSLEAQTGDHPDARPILGCNAGWSSTRSRVEHHDVHANASYETVPTDL
jgi:hypothetical protein